MHCNALQRTATHCNALQHTQSHDLLDALGALGVVETVKSNFLPQRNKDSVIAPETSTEFEFVATLLRCHTSQANMPMLCNCCNRSGCYARIRRRSSRRETKREVGGRGGAGNRCGGKNRTSSTTGLRPRVLGSEPATPLSGAGNRCGGKNREMYIQWHQVEIPDDQIVIGGVDASICCLTIPVYVRILASASASKPPSTRCCNVLGSTQLVLKPDSWWVRERSGGWDRKGAIVCVHVYGYMYALIEFLKLKPGSWQVQGSGAEYERKRVPVPLCVYMNVGTHIHTYTHMYTHTFMCGAEVGKENVLSGLTPKLRKVTTSETLNPSMKAIYCVGSSELKSLFRLLLLLLHFLLLLLLLLKQFEALNAIQPPFEVDRRVNSVCPVHIASHRNRMLAGRGQHTRRRRHN